MFTSLSSLDRIERAREALEGSHCKTAGSTCFLANADAFSIKYSAFCFVILRSEQAVNYASKLLLSQQTVQRVNDGVSMSKFSSPVFGESFL